MKSTSPTPRLRVLALAGLMVCVLFGCSRCGRGEAPLTGLESPPAPGTATPGQMEGTPVTERPRPGETTLITELEIVHFAYDSSELNADAVAALEQDAEWLRDNPDLAVLIEGHCDERGTDEYNYALGERRANAVLGYLQRLGVENELFTRSYGETRPAREGHDESAWRWNRRAQFSRYAD